MSPNSSATVQIRNSFGKTITNVKLSHRYDQDHYDPSLQVDTLPNGGVSRSIQIGFWTGFLRTGKDYWHIIFECDEREYSCKDNFYCFLTKSDVGGNVTCEIYNDRMVVWPPVSSSDSVSLESISVFKVRRPFYLICHRANDVGIVKHSLQHGANAVECDLQYHEDGNLIFVNHDICAGPKLNEWLDGVSNLGGGNNNSQQGRLSVILFDCKFATSNDKEKVRKGMVLLHSSVRRYINSRSGISVIFCIASLDDNEAFDPILQLGMNANEGISFDYKNSPNDVEKWFKKKGVKNAWYGDGIFVGGFRIGNEDKRNTRRACTVRDKHSQNDDVGMKKVYHWTLAKASSIQSAIDDGLDGIMVNKSTIQDARKIIGKSKKAYLASSSGNKHFEVYREEK